MLNCYFLIVFLLATVFNAEAKDTYSARQYACDKSQCDDVVGLDCVCARNAPPGGLDPNDVPQFVTLTADDDVSDQTHAPMVTVLEGHKNPNGCPIPATYFVSIHWTQMEIVNQLYKDGNEIADHTVGHKGNPSEKQIVDARNDIVQNTDIPEGRVAGFRAPFLKANPNTRKFLYKNGFTYDSSITEQAGDGNINEASLKKKLWPYTMDFGIAQNCHNAGDVHCSNDERYPGLWEIPMLDLQNEYGVAVGSMDPVNGEAYDLYKRDFLRSYTGSKAPFGMYIHPAWLLSDDKRIASVSKFFSELDGMDDVWVVTNQELIEYMRNPMTKDAYRTMRQSQGCGVAPFHMKSIPHVDVPVQKAEVPEPKVNNTVSDLAHKAQGQLEVKVAKPVKLTPVLQHPNTPVLRSGSTFLEPQNDYDGACTVLPSQRLTGGSVLSEQVTPFIMPVNDVQDCLTACHESDECQQYVFVTSSKICYRSKVVSDWDGLTMAGFVSGNCKKMQKEPQLVQEWQGANATTDTKAQEIIANQVRNMIKHGGRK